jgi:hypothetical protein
MVKRYSPASTGRSYAIHMSQVTSQILVTLAAPLPFLPRLPTRSHPRLARLWSLIPPRRETKVIPYSLSPFPYPDQSRESLFPSPRPKLREFKTQGDTSF